MNCLKPSPLNPMSKAKNDIKYWLGLAGNAPRETEGDTE
jgi:hypothetical protein